MTRPPPRPPLFPYTTLFRSIQESERSLGARQVGLEACRFLADGLQRLVELGQVGHHHEQLAKRQPPGKHVVRADREDRKSTRLNSSHMSISYAVFCLKKKKK